MTSIKLTSLKLLGSALAALSLSACVSFLPDPAPADVVYRLSPSAAGVMQSPTAKVVRIDRPAVSLILETRAIMVSPDGRRLLAAEGAKWSELIPVMVQESFIDVMGQRANLVGVIPSSGARTDTRVHITIKRFEAEFDQGEERAPLATVHYAMTLSDASNRNLIDSYDVYKTVRANEVRVSSIVEAMDAANKGALNELADWLESSPIQG